MINKIPFMVVFLLIFFNYLVRERILIYDAAIPKHTVHVVWLRLRLNESVAPLPPVLSGQ